MLIMKHIVYKKQITLIILMKFKWETLLKKEKQKKETKQNTN